MDHVDAPRLTDTSEIGEIIMDDSPESDDSPMAPPLTRRLSSTSRAQENMKKFFTSASRTISNAVQRNHEELKDSEDLIEEEIPILAELGPAALFRYHLNDWLQIVLVILLWLLCFLVPPFQRHVGEKNFATPELRYPFKSNTIPFQAVPVIAVFVPLVVIVGIFIKRRNFRDLHHALLGLLTAVALTALITDAVKVGIGRPRPHFYARCFGGTLAQPNYDPVTGNVICVATAKEMKEAYKSFPSGHTSWTFAGLSYLAMYMAGKLSIFDRKGHSWKVLPIIVVMLCATFVGVTRIDDYWHHWTDVCTGASIGTLTAYFCYRQHFRSLFDDLPHSTYDYIPVGSVPRATQIKSKRSVSAPPENSSFDNSSYDKTSYDVEQGRVTDSFDHK
uniref:Phosphatidic acid phosphatase type 2/haloperoxidase domain-containing protein n=1 Tax=Physcomitrium patens TaxID=3218 RepID=A0A7I4CE39_PHYPA